MKYVMFETPDGSRFPIVIPEHIDHSLFANALKETHPGIKAVSAGKVSINLLDADNTAAVYGESVTLKMKPDPTEDSYWLGKLFNPDN